MESDGASDWQIREINDDFASNCSPGIGRVLVQHRSHSKHQSGAFSVELTGIKRKSPERVQLLVATEYADISELSR